MDWTEDTFSTNFPPLISLFHWTISRLFRLFHASFAILEESLTSLEDKLSCDSRYLKVNIGCKLPIKYHGDSIKSDVFHHLNTLFCV